MGPWQRTAGVIALVAAGGGLALGIAGHVLREGRAGDFNDACLLRERPGDRVR